MMHKDILELYEKSSIVKHGRRFRFVFLYDLDTTRPTEFFFQEPLGGFYGIKEESENKDITHKDMVR